MKILCNVIVAADHLGNTPLVWYCKPLNWIVVFFLFVCVLNLLLSSRWSEVTLSHDTHLHTFGLPGFLRLGPSNLIFFFFFFGCVLTAVMDGEQQIRLHIFWHCKMCLCNFHDSEEQKGCCSFSSTAPVLVVPPSHSSVHTFASRGLTDKNDATPEVHCYLTATPMYFQWRVTVFSLCRIPAGSHS